MAFLMKGVAYITGAGSGIGQYTAYAFARQGCRSFALIDRNPLTKTTSQLKQDYPDIKIKEIVMDVTSESAVDDSIVQTVKEFGRVDHCVNNAGIGGIIKTTEEIPLDDFEKVLAVNTKGVWLCQRAQIRQLLKQERRTESLRSYRGTIVNNASMYGLVGASLTTPSTAYATSKHAVLGMTKGDAISFAAKGIRINAICPGYVKTPLVMETMSEQAITKEAAKVPLERFAEMEEIGDAITWLSMDASSYVVGAPMVVDGGFTQH